MKDITMILYSFQHSSCLKELFNNGYMIGRTNDADDVISFSYPIMKNKLKEKTNQDLSSDMIWSWVSKPDLRSSNYKDSGKVLITFKADEDDILLSNFLDWHYYLLGVEGDIPDIFNVKWVDPKDIQAVVWKINVKDVINIQFI